MNPRTVKLIDPARNVLAVARVSLQRDHYEGEIDLHALPDSAREVFNEFEEIVNGQMFSFLDEIQQKIVGLDLRILLENGHEALIQDLQVFPSTRAVSFKIAAAQVAAMKSA